MNNEKIRENIDKANDLLQEVVKLTKGLPCLGRLGKETCHNKRSTSEGKCGHCQLRLEAKSLSDLAGIVRTEDYISRNGLPSNG